MILAENCGLLNPFSESEENQSEHFNIFSQATSIETWLAH